MTVSCECGQKVKFTHLENPSAASKKVKNPLTGEKRKKPQEEQQRRDPPSASAHTMRLKLYFKKVFLVYTYTGSEVPCSFD